jgi:hypothetical protein
VKELLEKDAAVSYSDLIGGTDFGICLEKLRKYNTFFRIISFLAGLETERFCFGENW